MADDDHSDHSDRSVAAWLEVEPLDDVARRRLVSTALSESAEVTAPASARPSRTWRWIAAAAAVVVVLVGTLALVTANGGNDEQQATRNDRTSLSPKAAAGAGAAARDVGDFGDLEDATNLAALRAALTDPSFAGSSGSAGAQAAAGDSTTAELGTGSAAARSPDDRDAPLALCGVVVPDGGRVVAQGTGTIEGRRATVALIEATDGTRSTDAVLEDPCELRHLP